MNWKGIQEHLTDWVISVVFAMVLLVPLGLSILQPDRTFSDTEKRTLATLPPGVTDSDTLFGFPHLFDTYYQDHFGLREWLIHRYHREMDKRFYIGGVPFVVKGGAPPVVIGGDGWLFFAGDNLLEDFQGKLQGSDEEYRQYYQNIREKQKWFARRNIKYIPLVAANKQSIYGEHLPDFFRLKKKPSHLDRLLASRDQGAPEMILDLRPALLDKKPEGRLYDMTDTHWNYQGAYYAYEVIMERVQQLFPGFTFRQDFGFENVWKKGEGGDLALMLGQNKSRQEARPALRENVLTARIQTPPEEIRKLLTLPQFKPELREQKESELRLLVLHDSFFNKLKPFVSENFNQALYIWQFYDERTMEGLNPEKLEHVLSVFKPDLVIEEVVERRLDRLLYCVDQDWATM